MTPKPKAAPEMSAADWLASRGLADLSLYWPHPKPIPQKDYPASEPQPTLVKLMDEYAEARRLELGKLAEAERRGTGPKGPFGIPMHEWTAGQIVNRCIIETEDGVTFDGKLAEELVLEAMQHAAKLPSFDALASVIREAGGILNNETITSAVIKFLAASPAPSPEPGPTGETK